MEVELPDSLTDAFLKQLKTGEDTQFQGSEQNSLPSHWTKSRGQKRGAGDVDRKD